MSARYCYCGVTFDSEVPLPGVPVGEAGTPAELEVRLGSTPAQLADEQRRTATFAHNGREALWWIEGIGRFHVSHGGRLVTMSPAEAVDGVDEAGEAALRLMLLHPVWALASLMRGEWLLDAAAVRHEGEITALIGPSACGKSTVAALLQRQGFELISDALLRVTQDAQGRLVGHPQAPWLQLWPSALRHFEWVDDSTEVRAGLLLRRVTLPLAAEALPITRIALLREQRDNDLDVLTHRPRPGALGFATLLKHSAGSTWLDDLADRRTLFQRGVALVRQARLERLDLPWGWDQCERLVSEIRGWIDAER